MPSEEQRKIVGTGDSAAVTLPPGWMRFSGAQKGDIVTVLYDGIVIVVPPGAAGRRLLKRAKDLIKAIDTPSEAPTIA